MTSNQQRRAHWTTVRDAKETTELFVQVGVKKAKIPPIGGPVSVRLVWYAPDARRRDVDSMAPMLKAVLDALVKIKVIPDDRSDIVVEAHLGPIVISRDDPRFECVIRELESVRTVC